MKAILKYDMDGDEERFHHAINGERYFFALHTLEERLRRHMKNDVPNAETFYDLFVDILSEYGVNLHD